MEADYYETSFVSFQRYPHFVTHLYSILLSTELYSVISICRYLSNKISKQPTVRYFSQPANIKGSATPYGANLTAGHYIQSSDARLYYEVYGKEHRFLCCTVGVWGLLMNWDGLSTECVQTTRSLFFLPEAMVIQK